ncbi:MAG: Xaa-Pro peptidase family protein, partial [Planctomycetota bacterium]
MSKFAARRQRLQRKFRQLQIDAMLVTHEPNVTYLTGFTGEATSLFLTRQAAMLISDSRFETQIEEECDGLEVDIRTQAKTSAQQMATVLKGCEARAVGFEADHTTVSAHEGRQSDLGTHQWRGVRGVVESLRAIKDRDEVAAIRRAVQVAEKTIAVVAAGLTAEQTEHQVVAELEYRIRQFGGSGCAFPPIVGVGPRAALPHAPPTDTRIGASHHVLIDWGARVGQYVSDLTRVFFTGKIPPKLQRIYGVVLNAQLTAIAAIRPGARVADVDQAARRVIA